LNSTREARFGGWRRYRPPLPYPDSIGKSGVSVEIGGELSD
jgi:hypothetical protein